MNHQLIGLIFCSGRGNRLMPLTKDIPKPILLQYEGKSFLELNVEKLLSLGAKHIYVNYSYGFKYFKKVLTKFKEKITLIHELEPIGHGKTVFELAKQSNKNALLYALNGDTLTKLDSVKILEEHNKDSIDFSMFSNLDLPIPKNLLVDNELNLIGCNIKEREYFYKNFSGEFNYKNTLGEYIINLECISSLPEEYFDVSFVGLFGTNDLLEILIKKGKVVKCKETEVNQYISVNTKEEYNKLKSK